MNDLMRARSLERLRLTRRQLLQAGVAAPIGAALLGASRAVPAAAQDAAEDFSGVTVNVACNPTSVAHATAAGPLWEAKTGGKVVATLVPYAERALKFASDIVDQNPEFDLYFASKDFVAQFGDRLYVPVSDLGIDTADYVPITLQQLGSNGVTYALPLFADQELFIYNQDLWTKAGLDPAALPTTWEDMYALTPQLTAAGVEANVTPMLYPSTSYWLCYYNTFGLPFLSEDLAQVLFDNDQAVAAWDAIDKGFKAGFFGTSGLNAASDLDGALLFNQGIGASQIGLVSFLSQAQSGNVDDYKATIPKTAANAAIMPGVQPGTTGSIIVTEGWGVGTFSQNKEAATSFLKFVTGPEYQSVMIADGAGPGTALPPSSLTVLNDPAVQEKYPYTKLLAQQAQGMLQWPGVPYTDIDKVWGEALNNLNKGIWTPQQCKDETVKGTKALITTWLTS